MLDIVYVAFPRLFWPEGVAFVGITGGAAPPGADSREQLVSAFHTFLCLNVVRGDGTPMLMAQVTGDAAVASEFGAAPGARAPLMPLQWRSSVRRPLASLLLHLCDGEHACGGARVRVLKCGRAACLAMPYPHPPGCVGRSGTATSSAAARTASPTLAARETTCSAWRHRSTRCCASAHARFPRGFPRADGWDQRVYLAGEHTGFSNTMHGAVITGVRAANELLAVHPGVQRGNG